MKKNLFPIAILMGVILFSTASHYISHAQNTNPDAATLQREIKELEAKKSTEKGIVNRQKIQKEITSKKQRLQESLEKNPYSK